jgi:hypothetical protein
MEPRQKTHINDDRCTKSTRYGTDKDNEEDYVAEAISSSPLFAVSGTSSKADENLIGICIDLIYNDDDDDEAISSPPARTSRPGRRGSPIDVKYEWETEELDDGGSSFLPKSDDDDLPLLEQHVDGLTRHAAVVPEDEDGEDR